jgi:hypothetical protein
VNRRLHCAFALIVLMTADVLPASAQTPPPAQTQPQDDPDMDVNFAEPDFTLVALPTTLRVPRHKSAFRVTHRFSRPLGQGDFGSLLEDLFGLDSGAQIGLEYRYGLMRRTQIGFHRTSTRTIEFFAQREVTAQGEAFPLTIDFLASIDGTNNFRDSYTPALGAVISRTVAEHAAFYLEPIWVNNSNADPAELVDDNDTVLIGIGTRLRIRPTVYLAIEGVPRVAGHDPGATQISVGLEKRSGGHLFQLTFTNGVGTTMGQIARGGRNTDDWHLGFSISRKFF